MVLNFFKQPTRKRLRITFQFSPTIHRNQQDRKGEVYVLTSVQICPMGNTGKVYMLVDTNDHGNQGKGNDDMEEGDDD